jgi:hypothetical protein
MSFWTVCIASRHSEEVSGLCVTLLDYVISVFWALCIDFQNTCVAVSGLCVSLSRLCLQRFLDCVYRFLDYVCSGFWTMCIAF